MAKNLDGIKKLNPDDIKKYRKIVLNYIGEGDAAAVKARVNPNTAKPSPQVDGLNLRSLGNIKKKEAVAFKKPAVPKAALLDAGSEAPRSAVASGAEEEFKRSAVKTAADNARLAEAIKRQEEERRKVIAEEKQYQLQKERQAKEEKTKEQEAKEEAVRLEKERVRQEKIKQAEAKRQERELEEKKNRELAEAVKREAEKKKEIARQAKLEAKEKLKAEEEKRWEERIALEEAERLAAERARAERDLEKKKRAAERKRIKQELKAAWLAARVKKKVKRQKAWRKFKKIFKIRAGSYYIVVKCHIAAAFVMTVLILAIAYAGFCLVVLRTTASDGVIVGRALKFIPVPAVITNRGIIGYNDFKKIKGQNYSGLNFSEKKRYLAGLVILRDLEKKYGLPFDIAASDLAIKYVLDKDFNQVGISRIDKIGGLLKGQSEIEQLSRYADEYNDSAYYGAVGAAEKFGPSVLELAIGQISKIIPRADGYYIVERVDDKNGQLGLKYLFVSAQTLKQYVNKKLENVGVFILAN
ncbi:MAG: hypothetical protein PHS62_01005 [Patescibacteria group bacterium]|nr:hypothetical protein [Patescibacteria group bacterium]